MMTSDARKRLAEQTADAHHIHPDAAVRDLIARERRAAAVSALREAATEYEPRENGSETSNHMLSLPVARRSAAIWLRDRADRLEAS